MFYLNRSRLQGAAARSGSPPDWPARFAALAERSQHPLLRDYYSAGVVAVDTPLSEVPLVALDFETTGLDPGIHGIVSIGLVPFDLARIRCRGAREWLVKPRMALTGASVTVHGITHADIDRAPDLLEVLEPLLEALQGRVVVAHYGAIERDFLAAALLARLGEDIAMPLIDTMALESAWRPQPGWWGRLMGREPASIRLAQSRTRYHLPHYRPHHALTDALACAELLQAQIAHHYDAGTPVSALWS